MILLNKFTDHRNTLWIKGGQRVMIVVHTLSPVELFWIRKTPLAVHHTTPDSPHEGAYVSQTASDVPHEGAYVGRMCPRQLLTSRTKGRMLGVCVPDSLWRPARRGVCWAYVSQTASDVPHEGAYEFDSEWMKKMSLEPAQRIQFRTEQAFNYTYAKFNRSLTIISYPARSRKKGRNLKRDFPETSFLDIRPFVWDATNVAFPTCGRVLRTFSHHT